MVSKIHQPVTELGLIGWPLDHSLSPRLHQAALREAGLPGSYQLFPVPPGDQATLGRLLERLRSGDLQGLNVTIPHKRAVMAGLQDLTPTARAVGAVNTLFERSRQLVGDNTDVAGFLSDLGPLSADPGRPALVLGAGGGARAVVYGLALQGWPVIVAARRIEQARLLAEALIRPGQAVPVRPISLEPASLASLAPEIGLLVNATPVGMPPRFEESPWPAGVPLPAQAAVYDLVYNPVDTALVRAARAAGLPARSGLGMLVEQAALAFERWTGRPADRQAMAAAVRYPKPNSG